MSGPADLGGAALEFALRAAEPLAEAAAGEPSASALIVLAGWNLAAAAGPGAAELVAAAGSAVNAVATARAVIDGAGDDGFTIVALMEALTKIEQGIIGITAFGAGWTPPPDLPADLASLFVRDLFGQLAVLAAGRYPPIVRSALDVLGILDYPEVPAISRANGDIVREGGPRARLNVEALRRLVVDPAGAVLERFGLTGPGRLPADQTADRLFPAVASFLRDVGLTAWYGDPGGTPATLTDAQRQVLARALRVVWVQNLADEAVPATFDIAVMLRDNSTQREILAFPLGSLNFQHEAETWTAYARLVGEVRGAVIRADGVSFADATSAQLRAEVGLDRSVGQIPLARLGAANGSRFEVGGVSVAGFLALGGAGDGGATSPTTPPDGGVRVVLKGVHLRVGAPPGDHFLAAVLPQEGLDAGCELTLAWTPVSGLRFSGSAALDIAVPIGLSLGPISVDSAYFAIRADNEAPGLCATISATLRMGPVTATAQRFGLLASLAPAPNGGNLGGARLEVGFGPPEGLGVLVDAGAVVGGGFINFDPANGRYSGFLQLSIAQIVDISALALLDTRLPGGAEGFSFLILLSAKFPPIQLGLGFTLNGLGGLAGIHRSIVVDALQSGVRNGTVGNILFPDIPLRDPQGLISDIRSIFPPTQGRYVFGPMAIIGWGTPPIVEAELGIILELPEPIRLAILGQINAFLPKPDATLIELHLDIVGILDVTGKRLSIDASLHDSRLVAYDLYGDMALRLAWGDQPNFALSVGGFNPNFQPPPGFPELRRLTVALGADDNPRLSLEAYLALTSNTVQFGARAELYAAAGDFNVYGWLGFDALFVFAPAFAFAVDLSAGIAFRHGEKVLAGVHIEALLSGPTPWHVRGEASISVLFFDVTVGFDETWGDDNAVTVHAPDPWLTLQGEIAKPGNWSPVPPPATSQVVTLTKPGAGADPLVDPLGGLALHQRAVPFARTLTKFGQGLLEQPQRFELDGVALGSNSAKIDGEIEDYFAPDQFEVLSDADRLSRPSFEPMQAGATVAGNATQFGLTRNVPYDYEVMVFGAPEDETPVAMLPPAHQEAAQSRSPAARAPLRTRGVGRFAPAASWKFPVRLEDETFAILDTRGAPGGPEALRGAGIELPRRRTKGALHQALQAHLARFPGDRGQLEVVPLVELGSPP